MAVRPKKKNKTVKQMDNKETYSPEAISSPTPRKRGRKRSMETEERPKQTIEQMREILTNIPEVTTTLGIRYINLRLTKRMIIGVRESSGKEFTINLEDLYRAYTECLRFTSPEVKRYIFMGHSPAVALLRRIKEKAIEKEETT